MAEASAADATPPEVPTLVFELNDGTKVETTFTMPYSLKEQIGFEEAFRISFIAMEAAGQAMERAGQTGVLPDGSEMPRVQWILWFGWFRARPKVASNFKAFLDQLADYTIVEPEVEDDAGGDKAAGTDEPEGGAEPADAVDPTGPEDHSDPGQ